MDLDLAQETDDIWSENTLEFTFFHRLLLTFKNFHVLPLL